MASTQTNYLLDRLENNQAEKKTLLNKVYKIKPMSNAVSERVDRYITKVTIENESGESSTMATLSNKRKAIPKCLSLMLLHGFFKVHLFHWIYWRYLHIKYSQQEMSEVLAHCFEVNNYGFFLTNLAYLQANSQMIQRIAKESSTTIIQELRSGEETTL